MREKSTATPGVHEHGPGKSLVPDRPKKGRKTTPGRYLACSGDTYLFQIRVPAVFGKHRPLIRISLGKTPRDKAHRLAADLAAQARSLFQEMIAPDPSAASVTWSEVARPNVPDFNGAGALAVIKSSLKAHLSRQDLEHIPEPRDTKWLDLARERLAEDVKKMARDVIGELLLQAANYIRHNVVADDQSTDFPFPASSPPEPGDRSPEPSSSGEASSDMGYINRKADETKARCSGDQAVVKPVSSRTAQRTPAYLLDRKRVQRATSWAPHFSTVINDYLTLRATTAGHRSKDVSTADFRLRVFLDLIGDHPVDRYEAADLQAFVCLMEDWPAKDALRRSMTAQIVLAQSRRFHQAPISEKSLRDGYVAVVRAAMRSGMTDYNYRDPFQNARLRYPSKLTRSRQTAPISAQQLTKIFRVGVQTGHMDQMMLTLLSHLTGRRLSALIYLRGRDIFEKYPGIWVAQPSDFVEINGERRRVPLKTDESRQFFVLHRFLHEIGFVKWAVTCKDQFLFPDLMRMQDPSKTASQYMQRLFAKAGVLPGRGEVFHSLRGDCIEQLRAWEIDARTIRLQVGHAVGLDEHSRYGSAAIQEAKAALLANVPLSAGVNYSMFDGLSFEAISTNFRKKGVLGKGLSRQ